MLETDFPSLIINLRKDGEFTVVADSWVRHNNPGVGARRKLFPYHSGLCYIQFVLTKFSVIEGACI